MADETPPLYDLRQVLDDAMLTHTGRSIGDLASQRVLDDIMPYIAAMQQAELAETRIKAAAEIHEEGHRLMVHDKYPRYATLHKLLTFIERKYGRDNLAASWDDK